MIYIVVMTTSALSMSRTETCLLIRMPRAIFELVYMLLSCAL